MSGPASQRWPSAASCRSSDGRARRPLRRPAEQPWRARKPAGIACFGFADAPSLQLAVNHLATMKRTGEAIELLPISTCQRHELFCMADRPPHSIAGSGPACDMISGLPQRSTWLGGQSDAALRMFQLASGLLSDVPGERSILNQFQAARRAAQRAGWCGRRLGELSRRAMEAGERVRARAAQSATILELSDLVLDVLLHESRLACTPVADRRPRVLLLGAGEVARSIHGALMGAGVCGITWATRRPTRHRGKCIPLPQARERIGEFDVVIAALADAAGLIDAAQLPQSTISVDVSVPAAMTGARWPLGRILEHAAAKLSAQREALRRASHGLAGLADAALAEVVAPSIAPAALSITAFRNQIVDRELARLAPILNALPDLQAQALRKSIRHTAARCVHPLHETVNQLARHGRWQQAVTMIDHLLGSRVGWESIDSPAHGAGDHERGEASRSNPAPESA